jgi:hypothetical protein
VFVDRILDACRTAPKRSELGYAQIVKLKGINSRV